MYVEPQELRTIQWEPTSFCNANCIGCPRTDLDTMLTRPHIAAMQRHSTEQESDAFVLSVVDKRLKKLREVVYNGDIGDAMMHPNIDDIIIEIDKKRPWFNISTPTAAGPGMKNLKRLPNTSMEIFRKIYFLYFPSMA